MKHRIILVTGGASGIGRSACERFAAGGDTVIVADLDADAARRCAAALGGAAIGLGCDVAVATDAKAAIAACLARFGRLDVLVNNAGVIDSPARATLDTPLEDLRRLLSVNLTGAFAMACAAAPSMAAQGGGAVINLASAGGFVASPNRAGYGSSKAALMAMTRALAEEWASLNISVTAVAPGYVRTAMVEGLIASGKLDPAALAARIPMGRLGRPSEIAEVIYYLASPESAALTGATAVADGGFMAVGGAGAPAAAAAAQRLAPQGPRGVVVTGAAGVAGRQIAADFARAGDRVMVIDAADPGLAATRRSIGGEALACLAAATDEAALERAADRAARAWGRTDVLVTVAGLSNRARAGSGFAPGVMAQGLEDPLVGAFAASKVFGRRMVAAGRGAVIHVTAAQAGRDAAAAAAAGGVAMLGRSLACEWAGAGVRVNTVAADAGATAEAVSSAVRFLAADAASYVTGSLLAIGARPMAAPGRAGR